jgi:hypothetical protein
MVISAALALLMPASRSIFEAKVMTALIPENC